MNPKGFNIRSHWKISAKKPKYVKFTRELEKKLSLKMFEFAIAFVSIINCIMFKNICSCFIRVLFFLADTEKSDKTKRKKERAREIEIVKETEKLANKPFAYSILNSLDCVCEIV